MTQAVAHGRRPGDSAGDNTPRLARHLHGATGLMACLRSTAPSKPHPLCPGRGAPMVGAVAVRSMRQKPRRRARLLAATIVRTMSARQLPAYQTWERPTQQTDARTTCATVFQSLDNAGRGASSSWVHATLSLAQHRQENRSHALAAANVSPRRLQPPTASQRHRIRRRVVAPTPDLSLWRSAALRERIHISTATRPGYVPAAHVHSPALSLQPPALAACAAVAACHPERVGVVESGESLRVYRRHRAAGPPRKRALQGQHRPGQQGCVLRHTGAAQPVAAARWPAWLPPQGTPRGTTCANVLRLTCEDHRDRCLTPLPNLPLPANKLSWTRPFGSRRGAAQSWRRRSLREERRALFPAKQDHP